MLNREEELRFCRARRAAIALDYQNLNPEQRRAVLAHRGAAAAAGRGGQRQDHRAHPPHRQPDEIRPGVGQRRGARLGHRGRTWPFWRATSQHPRPGSRRREQERLCAPGPGRPLVHHRHHLHQQGRRGAEGAAGADAGPDGQRHLGLHLPLRLRAHPPPGHRAAGLHQILHHLRHRRLPSGWSRISSRTSAWMTRPSRPGPFWAISPGPRTRMKLGTDYLTGVRKGGDFRLVKIAKIYAEYERRLREANALDFDDIILHTVRLLPEVRGRAGLLPEKVPLCPHRRVPGHQPPPVSAGLHCWRGDMRTSAWWATTTSPSTASGGPPSRISSPLRTSIRARGSSGWSRTTAPPKISWRRPTPSSATIRAARARSCGPSASAGDKVQLYTAMNEHDEAQYVAGPDPGRLSPAGRSVEGSRRALPDERPVQPAGAGLQAQRHPLPDHRGHPLLRPGGGQGHAGLSLRGQQPRRRSAPEPHHQQPAPGDRRHHGGAGPGHRRRRRGAPCGRW